LNPPPPLPPSPSPSRRVTGMGSLLRARWLCGASAEPTAYIHADYHASIVLWIKAQPCCPLPSWSPVKIHEPLIFLRGQHGNVSPCIYIFYGNMETCFFLTKSSSPDKLPPPLGNPPGAEGVCCGDSVPGVKTGVNLAPGLGPSKPSFPLSEPPVPRKQRKGSRHPRLFSQCLHTITPPLP